MRYIKLPTIIWYKVEPDKGKLSEKKKYFVLISMKVSTVLLSVSLVCSRIFTTYFN